MKAQRLQLSRSRGWRMPANTTKIDRSTKWGNPFRVGETARHPVTGRTVQVTSKPEAIEMFAMYVKSRAGAEIAAAAPRELRGRNLACWCKSGQACHGDVLLEVANAWAA